MYWRSRYQKERKLLCILIVNTRVSTSFSKTYLTERIRILDLLYDYITNPSVLRAFVGYHADQASFVWTAFVSAEGK